MALRRRRAASDLGPLPWWHAQQLLDNGDPQGALDEVDRQLHGDHAAPDLVRLWRAGMVAVMTAQRRERVPDAVAWADHIQATMPEAHQLMDSGRGRLHLIAGSYAAAIAEFDRSLVVGGPGSVTLAADLIGRATARWALGDVDESRADLKRALAVPGLEPDERTRAMDLLDQVGIVPFPLVPARAVPLVSRRSRLEQMLSTTIDVGLATEAARLLAASDHDGALASVDRVLATRRSDGEVQQAMAVGCLTVVVQQRTDRAKDAAVWVATFLAQPGGQANAGLWWMQGRVHLLLQDTGAAVASFGAGLSIGGAPGDTIASCLIDRGNCLAALGRRDEAIDDLLRAAPMPTDSQEIHVFAVDLLVSLAIIEDRTDLADRLQPLVDDLVAADPQDPDRLDTRDCVLVFAGRATDAIARLDARVADGPADPLARCMLLIVQGRAHADLGDPDGARRSVEQAEATAAGTGADLGAFRRRLRIDLEMDPPAPSTS